MTHHSSINSDIQLPIIIAEHGDLDCFESVSAVENKLEAIDVKNQEYIGFDSLGRRLLFKVVREPYKEKGIFAPEFIERVKIGLANVSPTSEGVSHLRQEIIDYFIRNRPINSGDLDTLPLPKLIELLVQHTGFCE